MKYAVVALCLFVGIHSASAASDGFLNHCADQLKVDAKTLSTALLSGQPLHRALQTQTLNANGNGDFASEILSLSGWMADQNLTTFGQAQARWRLAHPSIDAWEIIENQRAAQALAQERELAEAIGKHLNAIRATEEGALLDFKQADGLRAIADHYRNGKLFESSASAILSASTAGFSWGLYALLNKFAVDVVGQPFSPDQKSFMVYTLALYFPVANATFGSMAASQDHARERVQRQLFRATSELAPLLKASRSRNLRDIGELFSALDDPNSDFSIVEQKKAMKRFTSSNRALSYLLDILSPGFLGSSIVDASTRKAFHRMALLAAAIGELDNFLAFSRISEQPGMIFPRVSAPSNQSYAFQAHNLTNQGELPPETSDGRMNFSLNHDVGSQEQSRKFRQWLHQNTQGNSTLALLLAQIGAPVRAEEFAFTPDEIEVPKKAPRPAPRLAP